MIDMPVEAVVRKVVEQTDLSQDDVHERIKEKLKQLSGLISEEGAAHIVANDLGVQLYKTEGLLKVSELSTAAKNASFAAKVMAKYEVREFNKNDRSGKVANLMLGDESGRIRAVFWNEQVDLFEKLNEGDIMQIANPYIKENNGRLEVHLNDRSDIKINPEGVTINAPIASAKDEQPARELKYLRDLTGTEQNVEVLGTIVQVYDPRFFDVCPECNKRVHDGKCAQHGEVAPVTNYVTTAFLDDGTANVRTTFWKSQTQHLFGLEDEAILKWKDDQSLAQDPKHELLGEIIKIVGRAQKNDQFDRIELVANLVIKDIDPEKELAKIEERGAPEGSNPQTPKQSAIDTLEGAQSTQKNSPNTPKESAKQESKTVEKQVEEPKSATHEDREVKPEDVSFSDANDMGVEEEVISIDDLEDL